MVNAIGHPSLSLDDAPLRDAAALPLSFPKTIKLHNAPRIVFFSYIHPLVIRDQYRPCRARVDSHQDFKIGRRCNDCILMCFRLLRPTTTYRSAGAEDVSSLRRHPVCLYIALSRSAVFLFLFSSVSLRHDIFFDLWTAATQAAVPYGGE